MRSPHLVPLILCSTLVGTVAADVQRFFPRGTHSAFWVNDLRQAEEAAGKNPLIQLITHDEHGVERGPRAISQALARVPVSAIDPLGGIWGMLLPSTDLGIRSGIEATTSVFEVSVADVVDSFDDSFAVYSTLYNLYQSDGIEVVEWDVIMAMEYAEEGKDKAEAFLKKALSKVPADANRASAEYFGTGVYRIEYFLEGAAPLPGDKDSDLGLVEEIPIILEYAWVENYLLLAEGRGKPLQRSLQAFREGTATMMLAGDPAFRQVKAQFEGKPAQLYYYMDVSAQAREWEDWPSFAPSVRQFQALGLRGAGPLLVRGDWSSNQIVAEIAIAPPKSDPTGIFRLAFDAPENQLKGLESIPSHAESFGSLSLDLAVLFREMKAAAAVISPRDQLSIDAFIQGFESVTKVRIEEEILAGSRGELLTWMRLDPNVEDPGNPHFSSSFVFPLKGEAETISAVNGLLDRVTVPPTQLIDLAPSDFDGVRLWETPSTPGAAPALGFHLAHTSRGLILASSGAELRDTTRRLMKGEGETLSQTQTGERLLAKLEKDGLRGFHYTLGGAIIQDVVQARRRFRNLPSQETLRAAIGDSWWTLRAQEDAILLQYVLESPETAAE